jgi:membrane protease YdiL (CAAX protease family)
MPNEFGRRAMNTERKQQVLVLAILLVTFAALAAAAILLTPPDQMSAPTGAAPQSARMPIWQLALMNAAIVFVAYGLFALASSWFAHKLQIPWMYREGAGWKPLFLWPLLLGLVVGVVLVLADRMFALLPGGATFPHPTFPLSLIASGAAGIGEEILFRGLLMGLWAFLFSIALRRWHGRVAALWIGNAIAALAFSASHLPAAMFLLNASSPAGLPTPVVLELVLLNSVLGLVSGERYMRDGLVAAMGVHFWADVVWHVLAPVVLPAA